MASNAPPPPPLPRPPRQSSLEIKIRKCIPKELISETWKYDKTDLKSNVAALLEGDGKLKLGIFDSVDELYDTVVSYMNFPKDDEHFKSDRSTRVERYPPILKSTSGKWCIYKNDLYKIFDRHQFSTLKTALAIKLAEVILEDCWKGVRVKNHHEMYAFENKPILPTAENSKLGAVGALISATATWCSTTDWKKMAEDEKNVIYAYVFNSMDKFSKALKPKDNQEGQNVVSWVGFVLGEASLFIEKEKIDLPPLNSTSSPNKPIEVLRLFSHDNNRFVMTCDFLEILQKNAKQSPKHVKMVSKLLGMPKLSTLSPEEVNDIIKEIGNEKLENLDYVEMKIDQLMFTQTPIPYKEFHINEEGYCTLAVDVLYELLMDMIVAKKVFHIIPDGNWKEIKKFFESIKSHFDIRREIYFIDSKEVDAIKKKWEDVYIKLSKPSRLTKSPFDLNKMTFNVEDLIRILKSLKLDTRFGDIVKYANLVFPKLENKFLSYLHVAVARCLINAIGREVKWIFEFIEKQKSCDRMNIVDLEVQEAYDVNQVAAMFGDMDSDEKKKGSKGKKYQGKQKNMKS